MCKLFVLTKTDFLTNSQLTKLLKDIHTPLTETETEGFGYAVMGSRGIFGEKYIEPEDFKNYRGNFGPAELVISAPSIREKFGKIGSPTGALIAHGRTSTNDVSLPNTHPLTNSDWALIHNGIVQNVGKEIARKTTNDTEFILEHYTQGGIKQVAESIEGYYAVAALNKSSGELVVFRDSTANLSVAWIDALGAYIFATNIEIIKAALKSLKLSGIQIREADKNFHIVFNKTGAVISNESFEPKARSFGVLDQKSLGYSIDSEGYSNQVSDIPSYREDYSRDVPNWNDEFESFQHITSGEVITDEEYECLKFDEQLEYRGLNNNRFKYNY